MHRTKGKGWLQKTETAPRGKNHEGKKSAACPLTDAGGAGVPPTGESATAPHTRAPPPHRRGIRREPVGVPKSPVRHGTHPRRLAPGRLDTPTGGRCATGKARYGSGGIHGHPPAVEGAPGHPGRFRCGCYGGGCGCYGVVMGR